jgi:hypothetical protein
MKLEPPPKSPLTPSRDAAVTTVFAAESAAFIAAVEDKDVDVGGVAASLSKDRSKSPRGGGTFFGSQLPGQRSGASPTPKMASAWELSINETVRGLAFLSSFSFQSLRRVTNSSSVNGAFPSDIGEFDVADDDT